MDNTVHKDAPCLVSESRVLVAVHWSPSSRAESQTFTGTRVWGSSEQRVGRLQLVRFRKIHHFSSHHYDVRQVANSRHLVHCVFSALLAIRWTGSLVH